MGRNDNRPTALEITVQLVASIITAVVVTLLLHR